jgi:hypothetical protein
MSLASLISIVAGFGSVGAIVNCFQNEERDWLPRYNEELKVRRPGILGTIIGGAISSVAVWAIYGPLASFDILNGDTNRASLTLVQLGSSLVVGFGGAKALNSLANQRADQLAKKELVGNNKRLSKKLVGRSTESD